MRPYCGKRKTLRVFTVLVVIIGIVLFLAGWEVLPNFRLGTPVILEVGQSLTAIGAQCPEANSFDHLEIKANLAPSFNYHYFNREGLPAWSRVRVVRENFSAAGFFAPMLVICFFSIFYRTSRTSSESDSEPLIG